MEQKRHGKKEKVKNHIKEGNNLRKEERKEREKDERKNGRGGEEGGQEWTAKTEEEENVARAIKRSERNIK